MNNPDTDPSLDDSGQVADTPDTGQGDASPADGGQSAQDEPVYVYTDDEGKGYTAEEIKEWRDGHLRQSDYTRKTQELAEQRRELDEFKNSVAEAQELLQHRDPDLYAYLTGQGEKPQVERDFDDPVEKINFKINSLEKNIALRDQKMRLEARLKELPSDANQKEVMKYMVDKKIGDPIVAYRDMTYDTQKERMRKELETELKAKNEKAKTEALSTPGNTVSSRDGTTPPPNASLRDKLNYAVRKLTK